MKKAEDILFLPFNNTAREYGYIMWRKKHDSEVKAFFGKKDFIDIHFDNAIQKKKRIDWHRRRIAITYTLTRSISGSATKIKIERCGKGKINVFFK
jgi:hypothetical protein|tara:strand:+ start:174 stop:461 length:288 start_codon:yes stop_codon:yes gene_type:complete